MIVPSNINLSDLEFKKYEDFLDKNKDKIKGIYMLIQIKPFKHDNFRPSHIENYYKVILSLAKKYSFDVIGILDDIQIDKYSKNKQQELKIFIEEFSTIYNMGIRAMVRVYDWVDFNYNFFFKGMKYFVPTESSYKIVKRIYNTELFFLNLNYLENGIYETKNPYIDLVENDNKQSRYKNRFSIAHPDNTFRGRIFYENIKNSSKKLKSEIDDIYFGSDFIYDDGFTYLKYGNVMGSSASDEQIDYLFKIQEQFGINISLTINPTIQPPELLLNNNILNSFIKWLDKFYQRGLRICTISNTHLMKIGVLQSNFPLMRWKNTVNHLIKDTQSFINYVNLGYDYIQLDRSLSRNIEELEKISKINKKYQKPKRLYLLITEFCMQDCPFKVEHDNFNVQIGSGNKYFHDKTKQSHISCDRWRLGEKALLPRTGVNLVVKDKKMIDKYFSYVDVFKISGRMMILDNQYKKGIEQIATTQYNDTLSYESLIDLGRLNSAFYFLYNNDIRNNKIKKYETNIFDTKEGKNLLEVLTKCKNQCYDCHLCEKVFGLDPFDSLIENENENKKENNV